VTGPRPAGSPAFPTNGAPALPAPPKRARVSLIVPTYNGAHLLPTCLEAVARQTRRPDETVVVDDASTDDTSELLAARYPWVRVVRHQRNTNFVGAVNSGIGETTGEIVVLLNNDTEPEPGWLAALVAPLEADPSLGATASKLLLFDRRDHLHSAADAFSPGGVPFNRGAWTRDTGQFDHSVDVFGACGGAAAYRRSAIVEAGGFDGWLVSYLEDVDLSWRLQLLGYGCRFVPEARVYHVISATEGSLKSSYYCGRNFLLVLASDVPGPLLRRHWRSVLREHGGLFLDALRHAREPSARARLRGYVAGLRALPAALRRRRRIQALRRVPIARLERLLTPR
jgi:GT2 family glycosyltransferase